ncbi:thiopurine S-methyltransferase [Larkinella insperata]|uniref:Thiopurine S-methyltransferase n=1 Tax=Larkinella insperata TaxID=332158 RepID=A0ABW3QB08_9BACT|nr:thiopurine S-methyltransferase [Larkinella insperata]
MEKQVWADSWGRSNTRFHRQDVHPYVLKHLTPFALMEKSILVPLCGRSLDLVYFSQFAERVVGVEQNESIILQFFAENQLAYEKVGERYISNNLTIFCKDLFALTPGEVGEIDLVYDRASLVALPLPMRVEYLQKMEELTLPGTQYFLTTLEYAPEMNAAPFSITPGEVYGYFPNYRVQHVESPTVPHHRLMKKLNLDYLKEHGFMMRKLHNASYASLEEAADRRFYEFS